MTKPDTKYSRPPRARKRSLGDFGVAPDALPAPAQAASELPPKTGAEAAAIKAWVLAGVMRDVDHYHAKSNPMYAWRALLSCLLHDVPIPPDVRDYFAAVSHALLTVAIEADADPNLGALLGLTDRGVNGLAEFRKDRQAEAARGLWEIAEKARAAGSTAQAALAEAAAAKATAHLEHPARALRRKLKRGQ